MSSSLVKDISSPLPRTEQDEPVPKRFKVTDVAVLLDPLVKSSPLVTIWDVKDILEDRQRFWSRRQRQTSRWLQLEVAESNYGAKHGHESENLLKG
jgi:hypothetical protein